MICVTTSKVASATSSRVVSETGGSMVGVLVQATSRSPAPHAGERRPRREDVGLDEVPGCEAYEGSGMAGAGSIIAIVATEAPLLPLNASGSRSAPVSASRERAGWVSRRAEICSWRSPRGTVGGFRATSSAGSLARSTWRCSRTWP